MLCLGVGDVVSGVGGGVSCAVFVVSGVGGVSGFGGVVCGVGGVVVV